MSLQTTRSKLEPLALTVLRVTVGLIMAVHGWGKLTHISDTIAGFGRAGLPFPTICAYLAVAGEFLGGLGLIVGLFTPLAAFGISCVMAVAVFHVHLKNGLMASQGGFEYPLSLLCVGIYFMMRGAGPFSLDSVVRGKR